LSRRLALLGGTTNWGDCQVALGYLAHPRTITRGTAITEYERTFARFVGVRHAHSFAAGRVGLYGLLRVLGVGPGHEVLLSAPTHIVVANAIRYTGATPVFVDCEADTCNLDLEQARKRVTPSTRVLLLQHTFGIPADIDAATRLASDHGLDLIEDCVHALGATYKGRPVGSFGRAAFFSTEETKTISSTMGGMVVTDDDEVATGIAAFQAACAWPDPWLVSRYLLKLVVYHLFTQPHLHRYIRALYDRIGRRQPLPRPTSEEELRGLRPPRYEVRLSNAQAKLAARQLGRLGVNLAHREAIARVYETRLRSAGARLPMPPATAKAAYVRFPVWVEDREAAVRAAAPYAVLGTWFTSLLEESTSPADGGYQDGSCPTAEHAAAHLVNLPTHPRVGRQDAQLIVDAVADLATRERSVSPARWQGSGAEGGPLEGPDRSSKVSTGRP
jgi:dTDP-4-amino-4,6-dideoxygalactose transaminase